METTEKDRLIKIMEQENLTPAQFADKIGIQRPTLSHILNGRNAASLDVLKKTLNAYKLISSDWLILGVGAMYRSLNAEIQPTLFDIKPEISNNDPHKTDASPIVENRRMQEEHNHIESQTTPTITTKSIEKIVVFYSDNTYEELKK